MNKYTQPTFVFRTAIAIGYVVLGILIFTLPIRLELLTKITKPIFSILLIAYGIFRLYRAFQMIKEENTSI
jgi:hypothetical protein